MNQALTKKLYQLLQDLAVISEKKLTSAYEAAQKDTDLTLSEVLLERDLISQENLAKVIAEVYGVPYVDLSAQKINFEVFNIIPEAVARKHTVIAYKSDSEYMYIATTNPQNYLLLKAIQKKVSQPLLVQYSSQRAIADALAEYKKDFSSRFSQLLAEYEQSTSSSNTTETAPIVKIVTLIFEESYEQKASDIHIEPEEEKSILRLRVDGVLKDIGSFPKELHTQIITRIKVLASLRTDEHQAAQDGKLSFKMHGGTVDVRVSIVPTTDGEKAVLRLLSEKSRRLSVKDLGLSDSDLGKVQVAAKKPYGMILATGPTGSGKTTTLYSLLKILNATDINIMTIEDPVEYDMERVNQIQVNNKANLGFSEGLKSIVRQDPDVILVGEIRDPETASIAINSAMTGHLVLSSVHTNNAATAIPRLVDMEVEPFLVASSVSVIVAQRLVRKICKHCIVSKQVAVSDLLANREKTKVTDSDSDVVSISLSKELLEKHFAGKETIRVYQGKGCDVCHQSGYLGRVGIFEVLEVSDAITELITNKADATEIMNTAVAAGMTTMLDDGLEKVKQGQTSLEEIMRVAKE